MGPDAETIPRLLQHRRDVDGDRDAIVDGDARITYVELDDASRALASRLVAAGVSKGDRVGLLAPNGIEWATTALAVLRVGAVLVPLSTLLRPPELIAQLRAATLSHLVTTRGHRNRRYLDDLDAAAPGLVAAATDGRRHPAVPSLRRLWVLGELPAAPAPDDLVRAMEDRVRPSDDLAVMFTSGSRGAPKGVIHTHGGALRATAAGLEARCVGRGERLYIPMPFFWMGGFGGGLMTVLLAGATLLTEGDPEPATTLRFLERERVTLFRGWPDQAARLAAHPDFGAVDLGSLGDGSLPALLPPERRPAPGGRANLFGMTESFGPYCGDRLDTDLPDSKRGSCGRPFDGVEVRVVASGREADAAVDPLAGDLADGAADAPAGEVGEIWLRGRNLLRGITGRPRSAVFTADGWFRTGDLGRLDADGYLWYSGRLDDMFKVKGATVYPSEVEAALRSVPEVRQAFVTDVVGDGEHTEVGALVVTDADRAAVTAAVRERLSAFKVPTVWHLTADADAVPLSATGKVDKARLQALLVRAEP